MNYALCIDILDNLVRDAPPSYKFPPFVRGSLWNCTFILKKYKKNKYPEECYKFPWLKCSNYPHIRGDEASQSLGRFELQFGVIIPIFCVDKKKLFRNYFNYNPDFTESIVIWRDNKKINKSVYWKMSC